MSTYKRYALDCVEEAKIFPGAKVRSCDLQTCTAIACAVYPPERNACIRSEVVKDL